MHRFFFNREPETKSRSFVRQAALAAACALALFGSSAVAQQEESAPVSETVLAEGAIVYEDNCMQCHTDGKGNAMFPPLIGSAFVKGAPAEMVRIILQGRQGQSEVNGKKLLGVMPKQAYLSDAEIAAVVSFVRKKYGGIDAAVSTESVKAVREAVSAKP